MNDGLYLNGVWVAEFSSSLTLQCNDLTKPDAQTASFSNTFTLPDTELIRGLTANAEQVDAGGENPYQQLPAKVIEDGELVFNGVAEFSSFQGGWNINLLDSVVSFFDALKDKKLRDLDLSRLDHLWSLDTITHFAGATEGVVYPLIDYGSIIKSNVPYDTMCPAVYVKTIMQKIAEMAGYRLIGDWLTDEWVKRIALPFVEQDPLAHDEDWIEDRQARVTTSGNSGPIRLESGHPINVLLPLNTDNLPLDGWVDGKLNCYKAESQRYVVPERMYVKVQASVTYTSVTNYGAAEVRLTLERNGQQVAEEYLSKGGYYDELDIRRTIDLDTEVDCMAGDELRIRLTGSARTDFASYTYFFFQEIGDMWASFIPDPTIRLGEVWIVARNLPDLTCQDLFMSVAKAMCGTYEVNTSKRTIELRTLDMVVAAAAVAIDWSTKVEESTEPELTVKFEGYGKRNLLKWKQADEKANVGFGDGLIEIDVKNLEPEATLFELPFAACINSETTFSPYGSPILIKTRTVKGEGENLTIEKNSASPRMILIEPTKTIQVITSQLTPDGDVYETPVTLTACWWSIRPFGAITPNNSFCMAFSAVAGGKEQTLVGRYFNGLKRILRRPRMLNLSMYLQSADVATLDLYTPIRLKGVRAGSLDINNNCFYLNKVGPRQGGVPCPVTLIAIE